MNQAEFIKRIEAQVKAFDEYWEKNHADNPEHFPDEMSLEEWEEQVVSWYEMQEGSETHAPD